MFGWSFRGGKKKNHKLEQHERADLERMHEKQTQTLSSTPNEKFQTKFRFKDQHVDPSRVSLF